MQLAAVEVLAGLGARVCVAKRSALPRFARVEAGNFPAAVLGAACIRNHSQKRDALYSAGGLALCSCRILQLCGGAGVEAALPWVHYGGCLQAPLDAGCIAEAFIYVIDSYQCLAVPLAQGGAQPLPAPEAKRAQADSVTVAQRR